MKVMRKTTIDATWKEMEVGDQITLELQGLGERTVTCHKVTDDAVMFVFDEAVAERAMNEDGRVEGGYFQSDLHKWLNTDFMEMLPEGILYNLVGEITLLTYGEVFGHDDVPSWIHEDEEEQLPLMKNVLNRIPVLDNETWWGWLQNRASSSAFARVHDNGGADCYSASDTTHYVRPRFLVRR